MSAFDHAVRRVLRHAVQQILFLGIGIPALQGAGGLLLLLVALVLLTRSAGLLQSAIAVQLMADSVRGSTGEG